MKKLIIALAIAVCATSAHADSDTPYNFFDQMIADFSVLVQTGQENLGSFGGPVAVAATVASGFGGLGILVEGAIGYMVGHMLDDIFNATWGPEGVYGTTFNFAP